MALQLPCLGRGLTRGEDCSYQKRLYSGTDLADVEWENGRVGCKTPARCLFSRDETMERMSDRRNQGM